MPSVLHESFIIIIFSQHAKVELSYKKIFYMDKIRILWVDDEIDLLKAHILFRCNRVKHFRLFDKTCKAKSNIAFIKEKS
jgi:hypothetical protein